MHAILITLPLPSHLRAFEALAQELIRRGHRATMLTLPGIVLKDDTPQAVLPGSPAAAHAHRLLAEMTSGPRRTDRICRDAPAILRRLAPDVIVGDQLEPASGLLARHLGIPLISVACAAPIEPEPGIPLPVLGWPYDPSAAGIRRNAAGQRLADALSLPQTQVIARWARTWGLGNLRHARDCISSILTLSQMAPGFDYPRPISGAGILPTGPFRPAQTDAEFPADIRPDPSRPFVYASLGTLQGDRITLLTRIAQACRQAGVQVLLSHAGCLTDDQAQAVPADWVRAFVPQPAILARADLCVTHAGLNTTLECLQQGVPMLALPLNHDQPGVAARIARCGAGLRLPPWQRSVARMAKAIGTILNDPAFSQAAEGFAAKSRKWPGASGAIDAVESILAARGRLS